jgi:hypothetical protein
MEKIVKILAIETVTHNVKSFRIEKPGDIHLFPARQQKCRSIKRDGRKKRDHLLSPL